MKRLLILVLVLLLSSCAKAYEPIDINEDVRIMLTSDLHFIDASLIARLSNQLIIDIFI